MIFDPFWRLTNIDIESRSGKDAIVILISPLKFFDMGGHMSIHEANRRVVEVHSHRHSPLIPLLKTNQENHETNAEPKTAQNQRLFFVVLSELTFFSHLAEKIEDRGHMVWSHHVLIDK